MTAARYFFKKEGERVDTNRERERERGGGRERAIFSVGRNVSPVAWCILDVLF